MARGKGALLGKWLLFTVVLAVCVALGYAAYTLAGISWNAVVEYESPYASAELPEGEAGSAVTSRTVLVIVDGLRYDAAQKMGTLSALRDHGAGFRLTAPQPSLSYPNWTTILTGASPDISGVTTNWHEGAVPVESIFDTAKRSGARVIFSGPEDFDALYGVKSKTAGSFMKKWDNAYLTAEYIDAALSLAEKHDPDLIVIHLPDVDESGHADGGASDEYAAVAASVDGDLSRLVSALQDGRTTFVIVSDHGQLDSGGHGGWEAEVVQVPFAMAGPGAKLSTGSARLEAVAPTIAYLSGIPVPRHAGSPPLTDALISQAEAERRAEAQQAAADRAFATVVAPDAPRGVTFAEAQSSRLASERRERLSLAVFGFAAALAALVLMRIASWRALVASLFGTVAYYGVYNALFFILHGHQWSLSAFNSEDMIESWMNLRLIEAALATMVAAAVAAAIYPLLRTDPKRPKGEYLPGWLTLGPATALVILATLGAQIAWFVWQWGVIPEWRLPDLFWGFKYDLDLIQSTAVGFSAVLLPLVTYVVARLHPRIRRLDAPGGPSAGAPVRSTPPVPSADGSSAAGETYARDDVGYSEVEDAAVISSR